MRVIAYAFTRQCFTLTQKKGQNVQRLGFPSPLSKKEALEAKRNRHGMTIFCRPALFASNFAGQFVTASLHSVMKLEN